MLSFAVLWIYGVVWCFIDLFRSRQKGLAKGLWFLALFFFPVAGVFAYVVTRPFPPDDERLQPGTVSGGQEPSG
jgi:hypothetical protein